MQRKTVSIVINAVVFFSGVAGVLTLAEMYEMGNVSTAAGVVVLIPVSRIIARVLTGIDPINALLP